LAPYLGSYPSDLIGNKGSVYRKEKYPEQQSILKKSAPLVAQKRIQSKQNEESAKTDHEVK
jgi:hypothetical protein